MSNVAFPEAIRYNTPPPTIPPITCATIYGSSSFAGKRPPAQSPIETAGFKCAPEMWPIANAIVSTVNPKANDTPSRPMPTLGKPDASTFGKDCASKALPQPQSTNQNVPIDSARYLFMVSLLNVG